MAKNSREGNQSRKKRYYEALAERGIRPVQVLAPESAHPLIRQAATLMTRDEAPLEPRAALRRAGGANEPEPGLAAELEAAKARIAEIERQAEARLAIVIEAAERRRLALEQEKAQASTTEAQKAVKAVQDAEGRAAEALRRAEKAEAAIRQAKAMSGLKGRLVRFLAGDVLK
ncbi:hypothetical protein [Acidithiobacillus ferriphilus]|uniref:Uncharacterized protein n=1 Tax=Acidithiobacillus ferriphilus TaxID=1689834 RepID=A0ABU6FNU6_9PROT|nr:hypothetical protein [Acidithiobacillus ferriphilus]MEB8513721.1 hypothetical protein [Acidithiobacillus ferriphilus]